MYSKSFARFFVKGHLFPGTVPHSNRGDSLTGIIEAQGLRKNFGNLVAVDGILFTVRKGEVFGFWARTVRARPQP